MNNRLITYEGNAFLPADSNSTAGTVAIRDPVTAGINCGPLSCTQITKTASDIDSVAIQTTTVTLTATSARKQKLNATGGAFTTTLPAAAACAGQDFQFTKIDSSGNVPTIKGNGSELIGSANTFTGLTAQYNYITVWSDGTQWYWSAKG